MATCQWKDSFNQGVISFRSGKYNDALQQLNKSVELGGSQSNIYDSRAAVYEKLERYRDALKDARKVIELAPSQWQGYARCARLFLKLNKLENALKMVEFAAERVKEGDTKRKVEIDALRDQVLEVLEMIQRHKSRHTYHFGNLPLEIAHEIFSLALEENPLSVLTFSKVCRQWRDVVNNTPVFWSTLVLNKRRPAKFVKLWKGRSGGKITSLTMGEHVDEQDPALRQILSGFSWDTLRTLRFSSHLAETIPLTQELLVNLDELAVLGTILLRPLTFYPDMQARVLDLRNVGVRLADIIPHFYKLESLTLTVIALDSVTELFTLLTNNPQLHTLSIKSTNSNSSVNPEVPELIEMEHLRNIDMESSPRFLKALCSNASMPALQSLKALSIQPDLSEAFTLLLSRHPKLSLTELSIRKCNVSDAALHAVLQASPDLQVLSLTGVASVTATVEFIAQPEHCTNLKEVDLSGSPNLRSGPVIRLVKGRLGEGDTVRLESLKLDACPLIEGDVLPWLRSKVPLFSCVYMSKKDMTAMKKQASWKR